MNVLDVFCCHRPSSLLPPPPLLCVILVEKVFCFHLFWCFDQKASNDISNKQYISSEIFIQTVHFHKVASPS